MRTLTLFKPRWWVKKGRMQEFLKLRKKAQWRQFFSTLVNYDGAPISLQLTIQRGRFRKVEKQHLFHLLYGFIYYRVIASLYYDLWLCFISNPLRFCSNEKKTWAGWSLKSSVRTKYRFVIEKKRVEKYSSKYPLKSNLVTCASGSHLKNLHVEHILSGNRTRRRLDYEFKRILWRTLQFLWFRAVFFCYRVH